MAGRRASFGQVRKPPSGRYQTRYAVPGGGMGAYVNAPATFTAKAAAALWLAKQQTLIADGR